MLTLIGRELQDHFVYIVLAGLITVGTILIVILIAAWGVAEIGGVAVAGTIPLLLALFCVLGAAQMYTDRANRISSLLATSAVTRSRILAARVVAGAAIILTMLVPLLITAVAILYLVGAPLAWYWRTIAEISTTVALTGFACYCVGLLLGWTANKAFPALGVLFGILLVMLLVIVKGFGMPAIMLLLLFSIAALLHVWYRFTSIPL